MLKRVMRYIAGTKDQGMVFKRDDDWQLTAWADASYGTRTGARSQTGYCFSLGANNAVFYSKSQKQNLVTLSSTGGEYVALFHSVTEVVYLRRLLASMGFAQEDPTLVFQDNQSTILWAQGQRQHQRTKHIDVRRHFVREACRQKRNEAKYLRTEDIVANVLTKALFGPKHQQCIKSLGMPTISSP